jgi:hypothetical protein
VVKTSLKDCVERLDFFGQAPYKLIENNSEDRNSNQVILNPGPLISSIANLYYSWLTFAENINLYFDSKYSKKYESKGTNKYSKSSFLLSSLVHTSF